MAEASNNDNRKLIERLIAQSKLTGTGVMRRAKKGEGPARYVMEVMQRYDIVHAIWADPTNPDGYGHRIVSELPGRKTISPSEATFQVEMESAALGMERHFGYGRTPGDDWGLLLRVADGGRERDGSPSTTLIADMSPQAARMMRAAGIDFLKG